MSRMRHEMEHRKHHAEGGKIEPDEKEPRPYNAQGSEVEKEAEEKAKGGKVKKKAEHHVEGHEKRKRLDRPMRKTGGRVGSDKMPLTSAAKIRNAGEHDAQDSGNADEGP